MVQKLIAASMLALVGLSPALLIGAPIGFTLLKIDPDPVETGAAFAVVFQLSNPQSAPVVVAVSTTFDNPFNSPTLNHRTFHLAPGTVNVLEMTGTYLFAGNRSMHVAATLPNSNGKLVGGGVANVSVYSGASPPARPQLYDPGPDQTDMLLSEPTRSGVAGGMAGSQNDLFAVPKTGGVWHSVKGGTWTPLVKSPPRAFSVAVAPGGTHLAVGERADDNFDPRLGRSGLWESMDSGNSWTYTFDPSTSAFTQAVPAVAFSQSTLTLFVATSAGVARRPQTANALSEPFTSGFLKASNPQCGTSTTNTTLGPITALITSETRVWARNQSELFYSDDDGKTWDCWVLPSTVDLPGEPNMQADYDNFYHSTDNQSLAAFDDQAFVIFKATVPQSDPRSVADPRCNPANTQKYRSGFNQCELNNVTPVLTFRPATNDYVTQFSLDSDGRGLGGHRFLRAYSIDPTQCPALASRAIGVGRQVFISSAQSVEQATSQDSAGRLIWDQYVGGAWAGPSIFTLDSTGSIVDRDCSSASPPACPNWNQKIHSDFWDFFLPSDFCPPTNPSAFIGNDGGIFQGSAIGSDTRIASMTWFTHSQGLHVQTAQDLAFSEARALLPGSPVLTYFLGYPTQDNDSWWRSRLGAWTNETRQGDSNFIAGDVGFPQAITWRQLDPDYATLYSGGTTANFTLNRDTSGTAQPFGGSAVIQAIQALASDTAPTSLDMVMLVHLPLPDSSGNPVADPPGGTSTGARMAIIRNKNFSAAPDGPATSFSGWQIVNDNIPQGAGRLWLSGGHANTQYYLYTDSTNASCPSGLQHLTHQARPRYKLPPLLVPVWVCLIQNLLDDALIGDVVRQHGPAFVDPYDPNKIMVVTRGSGSSLNSIKITLDGGNHFCVLPALIALVTESGRYSIVGSYDPGGTFYGVSSVFHGFPLAVPSSVAFDRHNPSSVLVASPYTGLYSGSITSNAAAPSACKESWRDLTPYLPTSRAYISGTGFVADTALVTSEGRGAYALYGQSRAQPASYFVVKPSITATAPFGVLHQGNGAVIPWGSVSIKGWSYSSPTTPIGVSIRADGKGRLYLPSSFTPSVYVMDVRFKGDGTVAPAVSKFYLTVN